MTVRSSMFIVSLTIGLGGLTVLQCKQENKGQSQNASASTSQVAVATSSTATAKPCGSNGYMHREPHFCILLPDGYSAGKDEKREFEHAVVFAKGASSFEVGWREGIADFDKLVKNMAPDDPDQQVVSEGQTSGGSGKYVHYVIKPRQHVKSMVKGTKHVIRCSHSLEADKGVPKDILEACKSLRPFE